MTRLPNGANARHDWALLAATVAWSLCFVVLRLAQTWLPFAACAVVLTALAWHRDGAALRLLLRPTARAVLLGAISGAVLIAGTHVVFGLVAPRVPAIADASASLFALLGVGQYATWAIASLIALIASCEEVLFRGLVLSGTSAPPWGRICLLAVCYAAATAPLGSPLLMLCALILGVFWGWLRQFSNSLLAPIIAHVAWDLGVLVVWPLMPPP